MENFIFVQCLIHHTKPELAISFDQTEINKIIDYLIISLDSCISLVIHVAYALVF